MPGGPEQSLLAIASMVGNALRHFRMTTISRLCRSRPEGGQAVFGDASCKSPSLRNADAGLIITSYPHFVRALSATPTIFQPSPIFIKFIKSVPQ